MQFVEYRRYDAIGLAELIRRKEVSADEVLKAALTRLDEINPQLNLLAQDLRSKARAWREPCSDAPLAGVPFLLKDLLADWADTPTYSGSRMMKNHIAKQNSLVTQAYINSGLRLFGKTTTPEWGLYPVTESGFYGITRNPWHTDYTPGGSSGGSAAAVASGIVAAAHGSDGGGSIRIPAHNCGLFGLKPTRGRTAFLPAVSEAWQGLVCEHALTRTVRDSALLLDIATQTQYLSHYACPPVPEGGFLKNLKRETGRLNIAFWSKPWLGGQNDEDTQQVFAQGLEILQREGHMLTEASPQFAESSMLNRAARIIIMGETAAIYYRYLRETGQPPHHSLFDAPAWALVAQGRKISAGEMAWARSVMLAQEQAARQFFEQFDVMVTPVCPRTTPKIGEMLPPPLQQKIIRLLMGTLKLGHFLAENPLIEKEAVSALHYVGYTFPFNMSGNPAMSLPMDADRNGLPIGLQFAAAHGHEDLLFRLAVQWENIRPWADKMPV